MSLVCYKINPDLKFSRCEYAEAVEQANKTEGRVWFDIQTPEGQILDDLLANLQLNEFAIRLCKEARDKPGFYPQNNFVLMIMPVLTAEENEREMDYVTIICRHNFILSIRDEKNVRLQKVTSINESADWMVDDSISGFVSIIILFLSLETIQRLADLRKSIIAIEKQMDKDPALTDIKILSQKRTQLLVLEAIISGQIPTFQALLAADNAFTKTQAARDNITNALANLEAADRSLIWLGGRVDVIRADLEMLSQERMNRRLGMLTILSAIFMPMTFLAGIWGMNFDNMPELNSPYGYLIALSTMLLIGGAMLLYFRRRGWFD